MDSSTSGALLKSAISGLSLFYLNSWQSFGLFEISVIVIIYFISKNDVNLVKVLQKKYVQFLLEHWQNRRAKPLVTKPNPFGNSAREIGNFPCENDFQIEHRNQTNESINLNMVDESGSWMQLRIMYLNSNTAQVEFLWFFKGVLYGLPDENSKIFDTENCTDDSFKVSGFHLTALEPLRRWRILFNGILKNHSSQEFQHFKMNFM